jgi:hypothetical protein
VFCLLVDAICFAGESDGSVAGCTVTLAGDFIEEWDSFESGDFDGADIGDSEVGMQGSFEGGGLFGVYGEQDIEGAFELAADAEAEFRCERLELAGEPQFDFVVIFRGISGDELPGRDACEAVGGLGSIGMVWAEPGKADGDTAADGPASFAPGILAEPEDGAMSGGLPLENVGALEEEFGDCAIAKGGAVTWLGCAEQKRPDGGG